MFSTLAATAMLLGCFRYCRASHHKRVVGARVAYRGVSLARTQIPQFIPLQGSLSVSSGEPAREMLVSSGNDLRALRHRLVLADGSLAHDQGRAGRRRNTLSQHNN